MGVAIIFDGQKLLNYSIAGLWIQAFSGFDANLARRFFLPQLEISKRLI
jgi:hypothetical protein